MKIRKVHIEGLAEVMVSSGDYIKINGEDVGKLMARTMIVERGEKEYDYVTKACKIKIVIKPLAIDLAVNGSKTADPNVDTEEVA